MERVLDEISFAAPDIVQGRQQQPDATPSAPTGFSIAAKAETATNGHHPQNLFPEPAPPIRERITATGTTERVCIIDPEYVRAAVASIVKDHDLSRYIL
jgi:ATP-dependent HslUV protease ATP-binding subunit HslU